MMSQDKNTLEEIRQLKLSFNLESRSQNMTNRNDDESYPTASSTSADKISKLHARKKKLNDQPIVTTVISDVDNNNENLLNEKKYWLSRIAEENVKLNELVKVSCHL